MKRPASTKMKRTPVETEAEKAERLRQHDARRAHAYALVERIVNALKVDDGFAVTNEAVLHRDEKRDPLDDILRDGISFTFEGVNYDLRIHNREGYPRRYD